MRVKDLMSQPVVSCSMDSTLDKAAQIMWDRDCGVVPITSESGQLAGVVTDRDICMAALFRGTPLSTIRIGDVMTNDVCACHPEDDVIEAERLMSERKVHRLPVIDRGGEPIGLLSVSDVVRRTKPMARFEKGGNATEEVLTTLSAIVEPRTKAQASRRAAS